MNLVSGFVSGVNVRDDRTIGKYIGLGKHLLGPGLPLVTLFLQKSVALDMMPNTFTAFKTQSFSYCDKTYSYIDDWTDGSTFSVRRLILFEKEDLYLWNYRHLATEFHVESSNAAKDSLEYFMVQIQKLEWMRIAICIDRMMSRKVAETVAEDKPYAWIDFGIAHVFGEGGADKFRKDMIDVVGRVGSNGLARGGGRVRFAGCREWKPDNQVVWALNIYTHIKWVMAGGAFMGWAEDIERLAGVFYERCFRILLEKKTLMWEVNIFAILWNERRDLFELFPCNHNASIIQTYGTPIPEDWLRLL